MFLVIASSGLDGLIKIWELASGQLVRTIDGGPGELCPNFIVSINFMMLISRYSVDIWTIVFTPDSEHIATGSHGGKINLYSVESGNRTNSFDTRGKFILSTACVRSILV